VRSQLSEEEEKREAAEAKLAQARRALEAEQARAQNRAAELQEQAARLSRELEDCQSAVKVVLPSVSCREGFQCVCQSQHAGWQGS
jgi:DNA repair exonuclease SbcCD ATPase subunit